MKALRNSFISSDDVEVLKRFAHENLTVYLRELAN
jgi:hypothetical protein